LIAKACAGLRPEPEVGSRPGIIVRDERMRNVYRLAEKAAVRDINVLILGETGVGKEILAETIHRASKRAERPFFCLNCGGLNESLRESELFGYERGAFTDAKNAKPGLLEAASGGTVFLDEIGELPARLQPKLLQVLETQEILSVGSVKARPIDVRFLAATNRDLEVEAATGEFRSDLYYRLAGFTAVIPPLRERREDILPLAHEFLRRASEKRNSAGTPRIRDDAAARLLDYAWPGNVRELRNVIELAVILSEGRPIGPEQLPLEKMRSVLLVAPRHALPVAEDGLDFLTAKERAERERILEALTVCAGNQSKAAEKLGISRSTLLNRLDAYRVGRPRKRPG
jgi:transcriptional regulator with PAS, ATPase and Fis domain